MAILTLLLCVLNLALLLAALGLAWRMRWRMIRLRETLRMEYPSALWPQFESMTRLYRLLDGKADLPNLRHWAASPDFLLHVVLHIQEHGPKRIVECGGGSSTIAMALALRAFGIDGHIYSIDNYEPSVAAVRAQLRRHGLERYVTPLFVPVATKRYDGVDRSFDWYDLPAGAVPDQIDLLLVDGPSAVHDPDARYPAGPELLPKLARTAHVFIDDADRPAETEMVRSWRALFPALNLRKLPAEKGCSDLYFREESVAPQARPVSVPA